MSEKMPPLAHEGDADCQIGEANLHSINPKKCAACISVEVKLGYKGFYKIWCLAHVAHVYWQWTVPASIVPHLVLAVHRAGE
jgi:hypothetical protein